MTRARLRILVIGAGGQLSTALVERARQHDVEVQAAGQSILDLSGPHETIADKVMELADGMSADIVVNAAAYTAVDRAEDEPALAAAVNGVAPGAIAGAAGKLGIPVIHVSTDYVFDGGGADWWREEDIPRPLGVYGHTKLAGELAVAAATADHVILRTAWVYAPFGTNFVRTMLRLAAEGREEVGVVADQFGCPTCVLDIADAIFSVAHNLVANPHREDLRGVFHLVGAGEASWADFAGAIFEGARLRGAASARVKRLATADYPIKARRPANSRLCTDKIKRLHGISMPAWKQSLGGVLDRLLDDA